MQSLRIPRLPRAFRTHFYNYLFIYLSAGYLATVYLIAWFFYSKNYTFENYQFIKVSLLYLGSAVSIGLLTAHSQQLSTQSHPVVKILLGYFISIVLSLILIWHHLWILAVVIGVQLWGLVANLGLIIPYLDQIAHLLKLFDLPRVELFSLICLVMYAGIVYGIQKIAFHGKNKVVFSQTHTLCSLIYLLVFVLFIQFQTNDVRSGNPIAAFLYGNTTSDQIHSNERLKRLKKLHQIDRTAYLSQPHKQHDKNTAVIFITVDALRYDRTSIGGYLRNTTPLLNQMVKNQPFNYVAPLRSACAESMCGIVSLLSSVSIFDVFSEAFSLFEVLNLNGFQTHAVLSGDHKNFYDLKNIYQSAHTVVDGLTLAGQYANDDSQIFQHLANLKFDREKPQFFYFHLMGVHYLGTRQEAYKRWAPHEIKATDLIKLKEPWAQQSYSNNYDNGVLQTDATISRIVSTLKSQLPNAQFKIVITADHGEFLGERELVGHALAPYEPVLKTPLLLGGFQTKLFPRAATQADVAPTLLRELNIAAPNSFTGIELQKNDDNRKFTVHRQRTKVVLVRKDGIKWIHDTENTLNEVYDLRSDPSETVNLIEQLDDISKAEFIEKIEALKKATK